MKGQGYLKTKISPKKKKKYVLKRRSREKYQTNNLANVNYCERRETSGVGA